MTLWKIPLPFLLHYVSFKFSPLLDISIISSFCKSICIQNVYIYLYWHDFDWGRIRKKSRTVLLLWYHIISFKEWKCIKSVYLFIFLKIINKITICKTHLWRRWIICHVFTNNEYIIHICKTGIKDGLQHI